MSSPKSVAFFGATGGSTAPTLADCLKAGYTCSALVRSADKLTTLLTTTHSIPASLIASNLTIITGDIRDSAAVTSTLFPASLNPANPKGNRSVDLIISGIGCYPVMKKGHLLPQQEDPTLCEDGVRTILTALRTRPAITKPSLVVLSTTGISKYGRNVPLLFWPLYKIFLHEAHQDKIIMEDLTIAGVQGEQAPVGRYFIVRASLLTSGPRKGLESVRWDTEKEGKIAENAIGYTISRADVGGFVFEKVVVPYESGKEEGTGTVFSITY